MRVQVEASLLGQVSMAPIGPLVLPRRAVDAASTSVRTSCTRALSITAPPVSLCAPSQNKKFYSFDTFDNLKNLKFYNLKIRTRFRLTTDLHRLPQIMSLRLGKIERLKYF